MKKLVLVLGGIIVVGIVAFLIWGQGAKVRYEADRTLLEWQSAKLAQAAAAQGPVPQSWDAGFFLGNNALAELTGKLKGLKLTLQDDDIVVEITDADVHASSGFLSLGLSLKAASEKRDASLDLEAEAQLSYMGSVEVKDHREAHFRIVPITINASVGWFGFSISGGKFASDLLVAGLLPKMLEANPIAIPAPDRIQKEIDLNGKEVLEAKDMPGTVTVEYSAPKSMVEWKVSAIVPLMLKDGLWLLARSSGMEHKVAPDPGVMTKEAMQAEIETIRADLDKIAIPSHGAEVWISKAPLLDLVAKFNALSPEQRTIHIQSVATTEQLYKTERKNGVLGDASFYVELVGPRDAVADVAIGTIKSDWTKDKGLSIDVGASAKAQANIHVHADPGLGGGMGTSVGINGGGDGSAAGSINFTTAELDGTPVLAAIADYECRDLTIETKTDGKLKVDFGWVKLVEIGFRYRMPIDLSSIKPTLLLDGLPIPIAGRGPDGKPFVVEQGGRKVIVEPAWEALAVKILSSGAEASDAGWMIGVNFEVEPMSAVSEDWDKQQVDRRGKLNELALAQWPAKKCDAPTQLEILIGDIAFGPDNDLVKFGKYLVDALGDSAAAARRLAEETGKKIEGVVQDTGKKIEGTVQQTGKDAEKAGQKLGDALGVGGVF